MRDITDYRRHIENNCLPPFRKALAKEFMEKDKEIERLNNKIKDINKQMDEQINLKSENANEIIRLHSIIKEIKDYIYENGIVDLNGYDLLEILANEESDKE